MWFSVTSPKTHEILPVLMCQILPGVCFTVSHYSNCQIKLTCVCLSTACLGAIRPGLGIGGSGYPYIYSSSLGAGTAPFDPAVYSFNVGGYPGYSPGIHAGYPTTAAAAAAAAYELGTYPSASRASEVRYAGTKELLAAP